MADTLIKVHCPYCSNTRLFDLAEGSQGVIRIKCPCCKQVAEIQLGTCDESRQKRLTAYFRTPRI